MCWRGAVRLQSGTHHRLESCYYTKMSLEGSYRGQLAWSLTPTWQWDPGSHMPECMHVGRGGFCSRDVLRLPLHMCCVSVKSDPITHLSSTVCFHTTLKTHSVWPRDYLFDLCVSDIFTIQRFCASSLPSSFFMLPWFSFCPIRLTIHYYIQFFCKYLGLPLVFSLPSLSLFGKALISVVTFLRILSYSNPLFLLKHHFLFPTKLLLTVYQYALFKTNKIQNFSLTSPSANYCPVSLLLFTHTQNHDNELFLFSSPFPHFLFTLQLTPSYNVFTLSIVEIIKDLPWCYIRWS